VTVKEVSLHLLDSGDALPGADDVRLRGSAGDAAPVRGDNLLATRAAVPTQFVSRLALDAAPPSPSLQRHPVSPR
jgi:hypothetical protein